MGYPLEPTHYGLHPDDHNSILVLAVCPYCGDRYFLLDRVPVSEGARTMKGVTYIRGLHGSDLCVDHQAIR